MRGARPVTAVTMDAGHEYLHAGRSRWARLVPLAPVAAVIAILVAYTALPPNLRGQRRSLTTELATGAATASPAHPAEPLARGAGGHRGPAPGVGTAAGADTNLPAGAPPPPAVGSTGVRTAPATGRDPAQTAVATRRLKLGVVVNAATRGQEANDIANAVNKAVAAANANTAANAPANNNGPRGWDVSVAVLGPNDRVPDDIDAMVGGVARPDARVPWLLPGDPLAEGANTVRAELDPMAAGVALADDLMARGPRGYVGVIVADGPDAALADGISSRIRAVRVHANRDSNCTDEVAQLRLSGIRALAIATPPTLARTCMAEAHRLAFAPPDGILLAPSAAYDGVERSVDFNGARTVLGLPWPTDTGSGPSRFRATGSNTYAGLVAFAATELAITMARTADGITPAALDGPWRTDLLDVTQGQNHGCGVVEISNGQWVRSVPPPAKG